MSRRRFAYRLGIAATAALMLALTGCVSIGGDRATLKVFAPQIDPEMDAAWPSIDRTLAIAEPSSSTALDSTRIAVRPNPAQLQVYAGVIWSDSAPALVQSALVNALGDSGRFRAVLRPTDATAADLLLRLDLRHFEAHYAEGAVLPTVVVELQATLVDLRAHRVLASRRFRAEEGSAGEAVPKVVAAFEAALEATARALTPWVLEKAAGDGVSPGE